MPDVAIVTGSSAGIGFATARALLEEGYTVWISGRDQARLDVSHNALKTEFGDRVSSFQGDLTQTEIIASFIGRVLDAHGRIDVAVSNIGFGSWDPSIHISDDDLQACFDINFFAAVRFCNRIAVAMKSNGGRIVCISSIAGCEALSAPPIYAASKSALLSYMKNLSDRVAADNILVNTISPGNVFFEGGVWDRKMKENKEAVKNYIGEAVPLRKFGSPEDIARGVVYLVSECGSFITGTNLVIDGGQTRRFL